MFANLIDGAYTDCLCVVCPTVCCAGMLPVLGVGWILFFSIALAILSRSLSVGETSPASGLGDILRVQDESGCC